MSNKIYCQMSKSIPLKAKNRFNSACIYIYCFIKQFIIVCSKMINNLQIYELSHVIIPVMLLPHDFRAYSNIKVYNHMFNKLDFLFISLGSIIYLNYLSRENMPSHFKVKEYCPLVFRNLRERFNVDDVDYRE